MSGKATPKDIEYALQFGGELLRQSFGVPASRRWTLTPSGVAVERRAAERFVAGAHCRSTSVQFPGQTSQTYGWRP